MSKAKYISLNGKLLLSSEACLMHDNRGLLYGDSFNIQCRGTSSKVFFFDQYFEYIIKQFAEMQMIKPKLLKKDFFQTDIELLLQKNRIYQGFKLNIVFFRNTTDSDFHATDNTVSVLISAEKLPEEYFKHNEKGLFIDTYEKIKFPVTICNWFNSPVFSPEMLIKHNIKSKKYDNYILLNTENFPFKAIDNELIFIKDNTLIFSGQTQNNYYKIITGIIKDIAENKNFQISEKNIKTSEIVNMDEIMLINPVMGIQWVVGFKEKRYTGKISKLFVDELNKSAIKTI